ncbi:MAG: tyrosine-type recombinase/integrase [Oceanipulchritudo sp.]
MKGLVKRNGIYHYRIFAQGREMVRSTGCSELRAATRVARELKAKWLRQAPLPKKEPESNILRDMSIEDVCRLAWKARYRVGCSAEDSTLRTYCNRLRRLSRHLEVETISELKTALPRIRENPPKHLKPATVEGMLSGSKSLFKAARMKFYGEEGFDIENPFADFYVKPAQIQPFDLFPRAKGNAIAREAEEQLKESDEPVYRALLLLRNAGLRAQEAAHLKWCNVTKEDGLLHVCPDSRSPWKPKKSRDRFVPMHEEALNELLSLRKAHEANDDYILPVEKSPRARSRNRVRVQRIFKRSAEWLRDQGEPFTSCLNPNHLLRKYFGSRITQELGIYYASNYLGHTRVTTTEAYYVRLIERKAVRI